MAVASRERTQEGGLRSAVFVAWSGETSKAVASALREWLSDVFPNVDLWMSAVDIAGGDRWSNEIAEQLRKSTVGIICLTPENLGSAWIHFEAGALSNAVGSKRVCPYLFRLKDGDVVGPLAQFQALKADAEGTLKLVLTIHSALSEANKRTDEKVKRAFEKWWDDLKQALERIAEPHGGTQVKTRGQGEILEEVLELVRGLAREDRFGALEDRLEQIRRSLPFIISTLPPQNITLESVGLTDQMIDQFAGSWRKKRRRRRKAALAHPQGVR